MLANKFIMGLLHDCSKLLFSDFEPLRGEEGKLYI